MSQPIEHRWNVVDLVPWGWQRPVDHQDRNAQRPCRSDLGVSASPAGVLRDHKLYPAALHQPLIRGGIEGSSIQDHFGIRKRKRLGRWVDETQEVAVLGIGRKVSKMHAPHRQHDPLARPIQRSNSACDVRDVLPIVACDGRPSGAGERCQWNASLCTGDNGISAHLHRKRVRCVDHMGNLVRLKILHQPRHAPKTPYALRQGLTEGALDPSRKGYRGVLVSLCHGARERRRFGGTTEDQRIKRHG